MLALALAGCTVVDGGRSNHSPAVVDPDPWSEQALSLDSGRVVGTLFLPHAASPAAPVAVVINPVTDAPELLRAGMAVARYHINWPPRPSPAPGDEAESKPHGEQGVGVWLLASPSPAVIGKTYFQLVWAEGTAARAVVEYLAGLDVVAADRIGIAGISTNGFKVYSALLSGLPLRAAVIVGACADYHSFLRDSPVALGGGELALDADYEAWLRDREPIRHPDRLPPAALLLVNGGADHVIPNDCVEHSRAVIGAAYAEAGLAERFRQIWLRDATHNDLVDRTAADIVAWWQRWLQ